MISLLLYYIFISITCFNAGYCFYAFLYQKQTDFIIEKESVVLLFTGLVVLTLLCQVLVLFVPVNYFTAIIFFILFQLSALVKRKQYYGVLKKFRTDVTGLPVAIKFGLISTYVLLLLLTTGPTLMDDTESYHIQMVKWIQEYGTVPGIANLHERYGFNSSWFSSVALFSLTGKYNYYTVLNSVVSVWLAFYFWKQSAAVFKSESSGEAKKNSGSALLLLCLLLFLWPLLRGNVSTVNYDFITTAMILVLFFESALRPKDVPAANYPIETFLWPVYLFTVRIINFPLLLLSLLTLIVLVKKREMRIATLSCILALVLMLPFLVRNVMLSGYAFFPSPYFNFFNVDWKVDAKVVDALLYYIKYYNRVNNMFQPLEQTAALPFPNWTKSWYHYLFFYDKILVLCGVAGFIGWLFVKAVRAKMQLWWFAVLVLQMLLWFAVAPDPRFVYGPLLCGTTVLSYIVISSLKDKTQLIFSYSTMGILILFTTLLFASKLVRDKRYQHPLLCEKLPQPPLETIKFGNINLYIPERIAGNWNPRCFATQLPCLYKVDERLHLRGKIIKEGFSIQ